MDFQRSSWAGSQPEVHAQVARGCVTDTAGNHAHLCPLGGSADDARTNCRPVAASAAQPELKPVLDRTAVHPQLEWFVDRGHGGIDPAVIVEISKGDAPMQTRRSEVWSHTRRHVGEMSVLIAENAIALRFVGIQSTAGDKKIEPTVVVEIDQTTTPTAPTTTQAHETRRRAGVLESSVAAITKQLVGFTTQAGHHDIETPVPIDVTKVRAHAGNLPAIAVIGNPGFESNLLHFPCQVVNQEIARIVIGDKGVGEPISVEVRDRDAHALAEYLSQPNFLRHFGEGSIPIIVIDEERFGTILVGMAIGASGPIQPAAYRIGPRRPIAVIRNEQIQVTVIVVVDPRRRH